MADVVKTRLFVSNVRGMLTILFAPGLFVAGLFAAGLFLRIFGLLIDDEGFDNTDLGNRLSDPLVSACPLVGRRHVP